MSQYRQVLARLRNGESDRAIARGDTWVGTSCAALREVAQRESGSRVREHSCVRDVAGQASSRRRASTDCIFRRRSTIR